MGGEIGGLEHIQNFKHLVNRLSWTKCCFSGDREYILARKVNKVEPSKERGLGMVRNGLEIGGLEHIQNFKDLVNRLPWMLMLILFLGDKEYITTQLRFYMVSPQLSLLIILTMQSYKFYLKNTLLPIAKGETRRWWSQILN